MKLSVGIDEAGRGCVIGPLVVACVAADEADRRWFWKQNVRDSKIVPGPQRDKLASMIKERCWFQLKVFFPPKIDEAVRDRSRTLNGLELEAMAELLDDFLDEFPERAAYALVDAPSVSAQHYLEKLFAKSRWSEMSRLKAKHEADRTDRTVAAASILAKAERERLIAKLKKELGVDFGCGYAHDEATREFLNLPERRALREMELEDGGRTCEIKNATPRMASRRAGIMRPPVSEDRGFPARSGWGRES